jgi:hypothetical protein
VASGTCIQQIIPGVNSILAVEHRPVPVSGTGRIFHVLPLREMNKGSNSELR